MASRKGNNKNIRESKSDPPFTSSRDDATEASKKKKTMKKGPQDDEKDVKKGNNKKNPFDQPSTGEKKCPDSTGKASKKSKDYFPPFSPEKMDQDFFQYASEAHDTMKKSGLSQKHMDIATRWLNKLLADHYPTLSSKKNRNIYLSNLLLQIQDGALRAPLDKLPQNGPLPDATVAFELSAPPDRSRLDTATDVMLNAKEYLHTSSDGRTYIATKALDGDIGACAFIGISVGGDEPKWIKPTGEEACVPDRKDLLVTEIEARGDRAIFKGVEPEKSITTIGMKRKSKAERETLIGFYQNVLAKLSEAKAEEFIDYDGPSDPLLQKLLHNIQCEAMNQGAPESECGFQVLMPALERKITDELQAALDRSNEIERISKDNKVMDNDPKLVDLSSMKAFDPGDDIWKAAVMEEPNSAIIDKLSYYYPACVVTSLLMLLERQRQIIIDQEKKIHEQLVASMRSELLLDVKDSVVKYQEAQRRYEKLMGAWNEVIRLEKEQKSISREPLIPPPISSDVDNSQIKSLGIQKQLMDAQRKLDSARQAALDIDDNMDKLNCQIAGVQKKSTEAKEMLRQDALRWSKIICQMKADLKAQEKEIEQLQKLLDSQNPGSCVY